MSDKEILIEAIEKAIAGGWVTFGKYKVTDGSGAWVSIIPEKGKEWQSKIVYWQSVESIIFNPDFAKALWGDEPANEIIPGWEEIYHSYDDEATFIGELYKFHLTQMVIAEYPIKYLGENIETSNKSE